MPNEAETRVHLDRIVPDGRERRLRDVVALLSSNRDVPSLSANNAGETAMAAGLPDEAKAVVRQYANDLVDFHGRP